MYDLKKNVIDSSYYKHFLRIIDQSKTEEVKQYLIEFNSNIVGIGFRFVDGRHEFTQQFLFPVVDSPT